MSITCGTRPSVSLDWIAGDTENFIINRLNSSREPIDMTGMTAKMSLRRKYTDIDSVLDIDGVIVSSAGKITFTASSADTRTIANGKLASKYVFDCQLMDGSVVTTLVGGDITINMDVTR